VTNAKVSEAVNILLQVARTQFGEPTGPATQYRFSIGPDGDRLEIMHGQRKPIEWRVIPIKLEAE
jgi:hypothetical protein